MIEPSTSKSMLTYKVRKDVSSKMPDLLPLNKKKAVSSITAENNNNNNVEAKFSMLKYQKPQKASDKKNSESIILCENGQSNKRGGMKKLDIINHDKDANENVNVVKFQHREINIEKEKPTNRGTIRTLSIAEATNNRKRTAFDLLSGTEICIEESKIRKIETEENKYPNLEKNEKLFVRLVKMDISDKLNKTFPNDKNDAKINLNLSRDLPVSRVSVIRQPTKKVSKSELQKQNFININKTESMKMEEMLLKKFKRSQEKQILLGNSGPTSDTSESDIEPYVYEKTKKSVYETYEQVEGNNGQMVLQCLLCPFSGETFKQMSLHYKFKHRETPIEEMHFCNIKSCKFKTIHRGMLKWHMRRHMLASDKLETDIYPCTQCDKVFDQRKGFLIHLKHMHKDPVVSDSDAVDKTDYPCATCNFRTSTKQNLKAHIYRSHIPEEVKRKFKCNICGFETNYKNSFKKHLSRVHLKQDK
ncbi:myoneurin-like [Euwallacea fornicatus]|uniref:myoneurin-like n=1 Tax=Euwallacea fornicatus TaxID=995702 RepID=UPI00338F7DFE